MAVVSSAPAIVAIAAALAAASLPAEGSSKSLDYAAASAATSTALPIVIISSALACTSLPLLDLILFMLALQFMSGIGTGKSRRDRYKRIAMTKLVASP